MKAEPRKYPDGVPRMNISDRQQNALVTIVECGEAGPSTVAEKLEISVSTAYRGLIRSRRTRPGVLGPDRGSGWVSPLGPGPGRDYRKLLG